MAVAIIIAVAAMAAPPAMVGDPEHALDRAHGTADAGTNGAADHPADRAGNPVAFCGALVRTTHDALGVADTGRSDQRQDEGGGRKQEPQRKAGSKRCRLNLGFVHLDSLNFATILPSAGKLKRRCGQMVAHL
jgi:hypothetical protein